MIGDYPVVSGGKCRCYVALEGAILSPVVTDSMVGQQDIDIHFMHKRLHWCCDQDVSVDNQVLGAAEPMLRNNQQTPTHEVVMKNCGSPTRSKGNDRSNQCASTTSVLVDQV